MEELGLIRINQNQRDQRRIRWGVHALKYETNSKRLWDPRNLRQIDTWIGFE